MDPLVSDMAGAGYPLSLLEPPNLRRIHPIETIALTTQSPSRPLDPLDPLSIRPRKFP